MELLFCPVPIHLRAMLVVSSRNRSRRGNEAGLGFAVRSASLPRRLHSARIVCLALVLCGESGVLAQTPQNPRFIQDRFGVGFWVDPPADKDMERHYAEIAEANFTFAIGVFGAATPENVA